MQAHRDGRWFGSMDMIELVLVYCLANAPDRCVEQREPLGENGSVLECTMSAQQHAQEYLEMNPKYRLASWRCEIDKPRQQPA